MFALARVLVNALVLDIFLRSALHVQRWRCALAAMPLVSIQNNKNRYIALVGCIPPKAGARNRTNDGACSHAGPATYRILRPSVTRIGLSSHARSRFQDGRVDVQLQLGVVLSE